MHFSSTGISKSYGKKLILDNIDFSLGQGESAVIIGRNGAGKSTFLSILAGFLTPDSGSVSKDHLTGFVPQKDTLFEDLTVKDNLRFWQSASKSKSNNFVDMFNVLEYAKKEIKSLSGGMKKSVAICCALAHNPDILIMDEPFAGLDIYYKAELLKKLETLKNMGKTIIYTSHSTDEMLAFENLIFLIKDCKLINIQKDDLHNVFS